MQIEQLSVKEKIYQMFILGFEGTELNHQNLNIQNALKNGLGGVIFFANNFDKRKIFKSLVKDLNNISQIPAFTSIDQEGGLIERTIKLDKKIEYLTPMALASTDCEKSIERHYEILAQDLNDLGINMNYAPVLDVNTNPLNPIIGIRSFGDNAEQVIKYSKILYNVFNKNNILTVGKHFPGHGEACVDSHIDMPQIDISFEALENIHIKPFKTAIKDDIPAIMVAHVHYPAFDVQIIPASLSKNVITNYLTNKLEFKGLIVSDDMVMGGITKHYNNFEACLKAVNSGIDLFIFKDSDDQTLNLIEKLVDAVNNGLIDIARIDKSVKKILDYKKKYGILENKNDGSSIFFIKKYQKEIDEIALKSIKTIKSGKLLPVDKTKKIIVLSSNKSCIYNYSYDAGILLTDFIDLPNIKEKSYSLNPNEKEINELVTFTKSSEIVVLITYNAIFNKGQIDLLNKLKVPVITISTGVPYDVKYLAESESVLQSYCYKTPSLKAIATKLFEAE